MRRNKETRDGISIVLLLTIGVILIGYVLAWRTGVGVGWYW